MAELENHLVLKEKVSEKEYIFSCLNGTDLVDAYKAHCLIGNWFIDKLKESHESRKIKEEEKP